MFEELDTEIESTEFETGELEAILAECDLA